MTWSSTRTWRRPADRNPIRFMRVSRCRASPHRRLSPRQPGRRGRSSRRFQKAPATTAAMPRHTGASPSRLTEHLHRRLDRHPVGPTLLRVDVQAGAEIATIALARLTAFSRDLGQVTPPGQPPGQTPRRSPTRPDRVGGPSSADHVHHRAGRIAPGDRLQPASRLRQVEATIPRSPEVSGQDELVADLVPPTCTDRPGSRGRRP